jgi:hypothetical protein
MRESFIHGLPAFGMATKNGISGFRIDSSGFGGAGVWVGDGDFDFDFAWLVAFDFRGNQWVAAVRTIKRAL